MVPIPGKSSVLVLARAPGEPPAETVWPRHYDRWQWQYDGQAYFPDRPIALGLVNDGKDPVALSEGPYDIGSVSVSSDGQYASYERVDTEDAARIPRTDLFRISLEGLYTQERLTEGLYTWWSPPGVGRQTSFGIRGRTVFPPKVDRTCDRIV